MKRIIIIVSIISLTAAAMAGCGGPSYQVKRDEFRNTTTVSLETSYSLEDWSYSSLSCISVKYHREILEDGIKPTSVELIFRSYNDLVITKYKGMKEDAYVKVGDKSYKFILEDISARNKLDISAHVNEEESHAYITTSQVKYYLATLYFSEELENAIKSGDSMSYRFYLGNDPITISLDSSEFYSLQDFLKAGKEDAPETSEEFLSNITEKVRQSRFTLGTKGGFGGSFLNGEDFDALVDQWSGTSETYFCMKFGLYADITLFYSGIFGLSLQPEFNFAMMGGGMYQGYVESGFNYLDYSYSVFYAGINIPLLLKPRIKAGIGDFFLLVGPAFFITIDKVIDYELYDSSGPGYSDSISESDSELLVGMTFGVGYDLVAGRGKLQFAFTYTQYFASSDSDDEYNIGAFYGELGYAFRVI